jgi:putative oxidoreductase
MAALRGIKSSQPTPLLNFFVRRRRRAPDFEHKPMNKRFFDIATGSLRVALALAFLSAVADRFGLWGKPGRPGVSWGNMGQFNAYVAKLNWFLPAAVIPLTGWAATAAEILLGLGLLIGWRLRWVSLASALLLLCFGLTMLLALGPKAPLDYSVFTAACAAFLLFAVQRKRNDA